MKDDLDFFSDLAKNKMNEDKYREVVFISSLFPSVLDEL